MTASDYSVWLGVESSITQRKWISQNEGSTLLPDTVIYIYITTRYITYIYIYMLNLFEKRQLIACKNLEIKTLLGYSMGIILNL